MAAHLTHRRHIPAAVCAVVAALQAVALLLPGCTTSGRSPSPTSTVATAAAPIELTAEADRARLMDRLGIEALRPGADARATQGSGQPPNAVNYDEAKANPWPALPDALRMDDGRRVASARDWWQRRRPELVEHFDREVYGRMPAETPEVHWEVTATTREMQHGREVIAKTLVGHVDNSAYPAVSVDIQLVVTTPVAATEPVPVMLELGFIGPPPFATPAPAPGTRPAAAQPDWRAQVLAQGWGFAVIAPTSVQGDTGASLTHGIIGLVNRGRPREPDEWGVLRAWAWGASRALDYLQSDPAVDPERVGIEGMSRYGKAALVAMAYDARFAIGYIASSGAGGAKLARRDFGERVENVAAVNEYHWMAGNYLRYAGPLTPNDLPVDAHELIALCAPRPVFIGAGSLQGGDGWVDARGMFMAAAAAGPVYRLLGARDLGSAQLPPVGTALATGELAFREHDGGHTPAPNWPAFVSFGQRYFGGPAETLRRVEVDAAVAAGTLRSLQGVNGAPAPGFHKPQDFLFGAWNIPESWDATPGYREARIDLVRTHDAYGPGDIDPLFGPEHSPPGALIAASRTPLAIFPNLDADPENPASYNFGPTDKLIASIRGIGAQVLFRLGRSEGSNVRVPRDAQKYAAIAQHVVMHYNRGWAKGFRYGIRYWEIWNEPDLGRMFWGGTPEQFYELYGAMARAVKAADPNALVGGPAIARPNDDGAYREGFLDYVRAHDLPLDFFSWHWYATDSNDPQDFVRVARNTRAMLDARRFFRTLSVLDEWNYGLMEPWPDDMQRAAFVTSALMYMQDAPVDVAALYRADNLFGPDGHRPVKTGQALIALGRLHDTPMRVAARGADEDGFAVLAGRSPDGRVLQVLIGNYEIPPAFRGKRGTPDRLTFGDQFSVNLLSRRAVSYRSNAGYDLSITGLAPNRSYLVERFRITGDENLAPAGNTRRRGPTLRLQGGLPAPGIELIRITTSR